MLVCVHVCVCVLLHLLKTLSRCWLTYFCPCSRLSKSQYPKCGWDVCSEDTATVHVCVFVWQCVCRVGAGAPGCLSVSMALTDVDNCSSNCGHNWGSRCQGPARERGRAAWLDVSQLLCLSVTSARGVDWSILRWTKVPDSFLLQTGCSPSENETPGNVPCLWQANCDNLVHTFYN